MAKDNIDKLEQKKKELKAELENIQNELDESIDGVRSDVSSRLDPAEFIKKHPIEVVGVSIVIGFLAAHSGKDSASSGTGFSSALWYELKKLVTKKAISFATEYAEKMLTNKKEEMMPSENGSVKED